MTLSSEIIERGSIGCSKCPQQRRAIRRVTKIKEDLIEVEACTCGDPEYNLDPKLPEAKDLDLVADIVFGDGERVIED